MPGTADRPPRPRPVRPYTGIWLRALIPSERRSKHCLCRLAFSKLCKKLDIENNIIKWMLMFSYHKIIYSILVFSLQKEAVNIASVDCVASSKLCEKLGIEDSIIKYYPQGKKVTPKGGKVTVYYLDNNNCAPSFWRSLCEFGVDCFGPRYKQSLMNSHNDWNIDGAKLLLSLITVFQTFLMHFRCHFMKKYFYQNYFSLIVYIPL